MIDMGYKVLVVGNAGTGKTCILNRYVYGRFEDSVPTTIGVEFLHKHIDGDIPLTLWDTAGQERFQSITGALYRGSDAIMFVYDVSAPSSLDGLDRWWREYITYGDQTRSVAILVGNKTDLSRIVPEERARQWAVQHNLFYEEVSARSDDGVRRAFETLVSQLRKLPRVQRADLKQRQTPTSDRCCF